MKNKEIYNKSCVIAFILILIISFTSCGNLKLPKDINKVTEETVDAVLESSPSLISGSIGGEFALKGIVESDVDLDSQISEDYYNDLCATLKAKKGILSDRFYTEYARAAIGVMAIGKDPENVEGYNLIKPLDNYEIVSLQGLNAESYAVLTARMAGVVLDNEDIYIDNIIQDLIKTEKENPVNYSDYTAIEILGLSLVKNPLREKEINNAIEKGKIYLSRCQNEDGSMKNSDSTSIAIIALTQIGTNIFKDEMFIKNGNNLADGLMKYRLDKGGFCLSEDMDQLNKMSTESALLALDAIRLSEDGDRLYK